MLKSKYTFSLVSLGIFAVQMILLGICFRQAILSVGTSGLWIGCVGLLCFLLGVVGFRTAWMDRELLGRNYHFPTVMMVLHGVLLMLLAAMYLLGLMH